MQRDFDTLFLYENSLQNVLFMNLKMMNDLSKRHSKFSSLIGTAWSFQDLLRNSNGIQSEAIRKMITYQ